MRSTIVVKILVLFLNCFLNCDGNSDSSENISCSDDQECIENYTPGYETARSYNSSVARAPYCQFPDSNVSTIAADDGFCTCGDYCISYSTTLHHDKFFYCGPCGRVGSVCNNVTSCSQQLGQCIDGYCQCKSGGTFYELFYCYIPYHGYELALQLAVATCIIIAVCLILISIYNAVGVRRLRRMQTLRDLLRWDNRGNSLHPDDTPPKYDDVVEDLPTYQDAVRMGQDTDPENIDEEKGVQNPAFENSEFNLKNVDQNSETEKSIEVAGQSNILNTNNPSSSLQPSTPAIEEQNTIGREAISTQDKSNTHRLSSCKEGTSPESSVNENKPSV